MNGNKEQGNTDKAKNGIAKKYDSFVKYTYPVLFLMSSLLGAENVGALNLGSSKGVDNVSNAIRIERIQTNLSNLEKRLDKLELKIEAIK